MFRRCPTHRLSVICTFNLRIVAAGSIHRHSRLQVFFKIAVLKNCAVFTGNPLCWSNKVAGLQALLKEDSNTGVFL